jgi:hypothetical protein
MHDKGQRFVARYHEKRLHTSHLSSLPIIQLLPLPETMLARGQARFSSEKCGVIDLNQHGFCQIWNRQQKKP